MTSRRTTYLDPKGKGDKSMFVKRGVTEGVYVTALQRLSDMVKAILPELQFPLVKCQHPQGTYLLLVSRVD